MKQFLFILFIVLTFSTASVAYAINPLLQTEANVDMIPPNPGPNEEVYVTVNSYGTNIDAANITWAIDGKTILSGIGEKKFTFKSGNTNVTTTLDITIVTIDGETIQKTIKIRPTSVDLMWQSESFVPPFYKGKPMFSHQNKITFIALPHITDDSGAEISPKKLIYSWKVNGSVIGDASGYGKDSYSFVGSLISRPLTVGVDASSPGTEGVGTAYIEANPSAPSLVMYKKSALYGIEFQNAIGRTTELNNTPEITMVAMPFFFGTTNALDQNLSYEWEINGGVIDNAYTNSQVFRPKEGTSGQATISLSTKYAAKILQYASDTFSLKFSTKTTQ